MATPNGPDILKLSYFPTNYCQAPAATRSSGDSRISPGSCRCEGSHRQFHHPTKPGTVTIAGHPSMDLDPKSKASILR